MNKWVGHIVTHNESKINLFCFPHAGSGTAFFAKWGMLFSDSVSLMTVQYPMRDQRYDEKMPESIEELVRNMAMEGAELFREPFAFFGHCAGGIIAYEAAVALKKYFHVEPEYLVVSSAVSPGKTNLVSTETFSDEEFCRHYSVTKDMFGGNEELMKFFLPVMRADYKLCEKYHCVTKEKLNCPVLTICGENDPQIDRIEDVKDWENFTDGKFELKLINGDHFYFQNDPGVLCRMIEEKIISAVKDYETDEI